MRKYTAHAQDHLVLPAYAMPTLGQQRASRTVKQSVPGAVSVSLVIDTASKRSSLIPGIVDHLQLAMASHVTIETSIAVGKTDLHWVRLEFPGTSLRPALELAVARLTMPPSLASFHGLIGRDLLGRWESLLYQGRRRRFTICDIPSGPLGWLRH